MRLRTVAKGMSALLVGLTAAASIAEAAPGFVTQGMNLRAGPGIDYPLVAQLPQGTPIEIVGCLAGWSWCDVATGGVRGWVAGAGLRLLYDDRPEPLDGYGVAVGLPFVGFDVDRYWGRYYRGRPWFNDADRWRGQGPHGGPQGGFDGHDRIHGPPFAAPFHGQPGVGYPVGPETFHGHGPERGSERGPEPGRGPEWHPERGPERRPERGPEPGLERGPEPGRGPEWRPERGPEPGRGPERGPERTPEHGPGPASPIMRPGPELGHAPPPVPHPEARLQGPPAGGPPNPGRPAEGHGGHDQPPH